MAISRNYSHSFGFNDLGIEWYTCCCCYLSAYLFRCERDVALRATRKVYHYLRLNRKEQLAKHARIPRSGKQIRTLPDSYEHASHRLARRRLGIGKVTLSFPPMDDGWRFPGGTRFNPPPRRPSRFSLNIVSHQVQLVLCVFVLEINHKSEGLFGIALSVLICCGK